MDNDAELYKKDNLDAKDDTADENLKEKDEKDNDDKVPDSNSNAEDDRNPYQPATEKDPTAS